MERRGWLVFAGVLMASMVVAGVSTTPVAAQQIEIEGEVTLEDGSPMAGVRIEALPSTAGRAIRTTKTKKNGTFALPFVEFGTYRFRAAVDGYLMFSQDVRVLLPNKAEEFGRQGEIGPGQEVAEFEIQPGRRVVVKFVMVPAAHFEKFLTIPGNKEATKWLEKANQLTMDGDYAASDVFLQKILDGGDESANLYYLLGRNASGLGKASEAVGYLEKSLELNPEQPGANSQMASLVYEAGDVLRALELFNRELELNPGASPIMINRGILLGELSRTDEAIAAFEEVLDMSPRDKAAYTELVALYMSKDDMAKAEELLDELSGFAAPDPSLWFNIGANLSNADRYEEAMEAYGKALALDPEFSIAVREIGYLMIRTGNMQGAIEKLDQYLDLAPAAPDRDQVKSMRDTIAASLSGN